MAVVDQGSSAYDVDFYAWAQEQARLLRAGRFAEADIRDIADEIESMGRSERRELINRLAVLLAHLLRWQFQPGLRGNSWRLTIREQRRKITRHLADNPSLASVLPEVVVAAYGDALIDVERETGLAEETFPPVCPYAHQDRFDGTFLPT